MRRYLGGLAHTFAWSSPQDGRWILVAILLAYFLSLTALASSRNLTSAWRALGVASAQYAFLDARFVTATLDCYRLGYDPYIENPCDPYRRTMNYPRIWLSFAWLGLTKNHTVLVGAGLAAIFFGSFLCWVGRPNPAQSLIFAIFLCSPHVMWIVERGNMDQVIFILLASSLTLARWYPKTRPVLYLSIIVSSILKLYPIAGMLVVVRNIPRRAFAWGTSILLAFSVYIFFTWPDPILIARSTPTSFWWSYGRLTVFEFVEDKLRAEAGIAIRHSYLVVSSLVAVAIASIIALLWARKIRETPPDTHHLDSFLIGSGIYIGTFLIGNNFDYKMIFLVLLLPQLFDWLRDRSEFVRPAYLVLGSLMLSTWGESSLAWIRHRTYGNAPASGILLQESASWLLFALLLMFNFLIMRSRWASSTVRSPSAVAL